jgi:4-hydroxybenzoate decarboxylase subunit C
MKHWGTGGLRPFLQQLEQAGELVRVSTPVSPKLEITAILERVLQAEGPAILFEQVEGSDIPVVANLFGSARRLEMALGGEPAAIGERVVESLERLRNPTLRNVWNSRYAGQRVFKARPRRVATGPVMEVTSPANLDALPVLTCWPGDAGRFFTLGNTATCHPETGERNLGLYRLQCQSNTQTGMHWQIHRGGGFHFWRAEQLGQDLPVTVTLGGSASLMFSAAAPLPEGLDELLMAGLIDGKGIPLIEQEGHGYLPEIIADAEIVLVGTVPAGVREMEGPFGDHFGHYSTAAKYPVIRIEKMYQRRSPVFPATVVGKPKHEDWWWGNALQEMMVPLLKLMKPEIRDYWAWPETGFHGLGVLSSTQRYAKENIRTAMGILGEGQASLTKCIVTVDPDCPVQSFSEVVRRLHLHFDPTRDLIIIPGTAYDTLDFTSSKMNLGSKMIMDATAGPEQPNRLPLDTAAVEQYFASRNLPWHLWGPSMIAVQIPTVGVGRAFAEELCQADALAEASLIILVSSDVPLDDSVGLLWGWFTRFEPARDLYFKSQSFVGAAARYQGPVVFDATWKEGYPEPLTMDPDVERKVEAAWPTYGISI